MEDKRRRSSKTTRQQFMLYLEELENNEAFRNNKFSPENPNVLTQLLNSSGGPQKTVLQWKKIFADWKCAVKKRARLLTMRRVETGGGPPEKPLTDLETKLINIIGVVVISGIEDVKEVGLPIADDVPQFEECGDGILQNAEMTTPNTQSAVKRNYLDNGEHQSAPGPSNPTPKRKNATVLSSLTTVIEERKTTDQNLLTVSKSIDTNFNTMVQLKEKALKLTCIQLQIANPTLDLSEFM